MTPRPALRAGLRILILSVVFGSTLTGFTARVFAATAPSPSPSPGGLRTIIRVRAKANRASRSRRQQFLSPLTTRGINPEIVIRSCNMPKTRIASANYSSSPVYASIQ